MLTYKGQNYPTLPRETYRAAVKRLGITDALAVQMGGRALSLNEPASRDAQVLTLADEEGRRIYERTLRFVTLAAFQRLYPEATLRFENSFGHGILFTVKGVELTEQLINAVYAEMKRITDADIPFESTLYSTKEAISYYASQGMNDKVALLKYRRQEYIRMYECGGYKEYFYGEMAYSTGAVAVFSLTKVDGGIVLGLPEFHNSSVPAPFKPMPKLLEAFAESNAWLKLLKAPNISDLNALTESGGLREFIRVNESLIDMKINSIAAQIAERKPKLILIAGPSSSGKTTFCNRLYISLKVHGIEPVKLSLDDYYIDRDKIPVGEDGKPDLESIDALDTELINAQLIELINGKPVEMPSFDFVTQKRSPKTHTVCVPTGMPILIEGIHGLNDKLTQLIPDDKKFKIYISSLTNINVDDHNRIRTTDARLIRRIVRDSAFRGTDINDTLAMWDSVRRGEEKNIFPFQEQADVMINSSLVYELAIMKAYAYKPLLSITEDRPYYSIARRLVKFLNYVKIADVEDEIPKNSLLREFIGGSCFY